MATSFSQLLRERQRQEPEAPCLHLIQQDLVSIKTYTTSDLVRALDRLSWWFIAHLGKYEGEGYETIAYLGPDDVRYIIYPVAALQAFRLCQTLSPRNSLEGNAALLEQSKARCVVYGDGLGELLVPKDQNLSVLRGPTLNELLSPDLVAPFPLNEQPDQPLFIAQTSGSTGMPKPIRVSTRAIIEPESHLKHMPQFDGRCNQSHIMARAKRPWMGWPMMHAAGIILTLWEIAIHNAAVVVDQADVPRNGNAAIDAYQRFGIDAICGVPGIVEQLCETPGGIEAAEGCEFVWIGGGHPNSEAAARLATRTTLVIMYTSTEMGLSQALYHPDPEDWDYLIMPPFLNSIEWRPQAQYFEYVIKRDEKLTHLQGVFQNFKQLDEWSSGDLFEPHPTKPHYWRCVGRTDDMIIFSNGSKLMPLRIEEALRSSEVIKNAFIAGHNRRFPLLLVQPAKQPRTDEEFCATLDAIWRHVQQVNASSPANGQIESKEHVILVTETDLIQSSKGVTSRNAVLRLYAAHIERVHEKYKATARQDINRRL